MEGLWPLLNNVGCEGRGWGGSVGSHAVWAEPTLGTSGCGVEGEEGEDEDEEGGGGGGGVRGLHAVPLGPRSAPSS